MVFTKGEADLKQEIDPEDMAIMDEFPGTIDPALEIKDPPPGGGMGMGMGMDFCRGGGWCIVGDEKKAPHEVLLLPRDPLELNDASVLRISLDHTSQQSTRASSGDSACRSRRTRESES